jgi:CRP/FNR family transcriptional regulator
MGSRLPQAGEQKSGSRDFPTMTPDRSALRAPPALFAALSPAGRAALERDLTRRAFSAGTTVIAKGAAVSGAFFVLKGALRVYALTPSGREATIYVLRPGDTCVLALNSLFADLAYPAFVRAEADTLLGVAPGARFRALFLNEPAIRDLTVQALSTLVFRLMDEIAQIHALRLDQRIVRALLAQVDATGEIRRTQQQLADHLGASREGVARILARLAAQGVIASGRGRIRLLDRRALETMAQ